MDARNALKNVIDRLQNGDNKSFNFTLMEGCFILREGKGMNFTSGALREPTLLHVCDPIALYRQLVRSKPAHPYIGTVNLDTRACRRCERLAAEHIVKRVYILTKIYHLPTL